MPSFLHGAAAGRADQADQLAQHGGGQAPAPRPRHGRNGEQVGVAAPVAQPHPRVAEDPPAAVEPLLDDDVVVFQILKIKMKSLNFY